MAQASGATVALRDVDAGHQEYRVRAAIRRADDTRNRRSAIARRPLRRSVQAATLYDERTGMFTALLPSDRGHFPACAQWRRQDLCQPRPVAARLYRQTQTAAADGPNKLSLLLRDQLAGSANEFHNTVVEGLDALKN